MKHLNLTPELYKYMLDVSLDEHPVLAALRQKNDTHQLAVMQIPPEQAQFMQLLIRLIQAKNVLELGTFTGYSALAMALALPDDGHLMTCDINLEWTNVAHQYWRAAGQDKKIELRIAPALETLHQLINDGLIHHFDFIFIDADKTNYLNYYELALQLVSPNGLIAIDNMFWDGKVIDPAETGAQVRDIRLLNEKIKNDERIWGSLLPIADGLYLIKPK